MATNSNYDETIRSLQDRRSQLAFEIEAVEKAITILKSVESPPNSLDSNMSLQASADKAKGIYSLIGIRWACLWVLAQADKVGLSTAAVAELLIKGGRTSKADRFASSVSAVLSSMKIKGEVEPIGNYWVLTDFGKRALEAIRPRLDVLAEQHLKYTEKELETMPLSKSKALIEAGNPDYSAACEYYFGGRSAASRPPF